MKLRTLVPIATCALLAFGCNGAESDAGGNVPSDGSATGIDAIRAELGLKDGPLDFHDAMESLEDVFYEEVWGALDDGRVKDAAKPLVRVAHALANMTLEKEYADDARFANMMKQCITDTEAAANTALSGDADKLRAAITDLDKQRCIACHKLYRTDD